MARATLRRWPSARPSPRSGQRVGPRWGRQQGRKLSVDVAFENAHGRAAHFRHLASSHRSDLDLNFAWPPHLDALQNRQRFTWLQPFVLDKISTERTARGAGGRIFDEPPRHHSASEGFPFAAKRETVSQHSVARNQLREPAHVHVNLRQGLSVADRDHQVRNSGGNKFQGKRGIEIGCLQAESFGEGGAIQFSRNEACRLLRHGHSHRAAVVKTEFDWQNSRAGLLHDLDVAFRRRDYAELGEQEPGADHRMAGERKLARGGEDAETSQGSVVRGTLHENRFREIHFASDGLHFCRRDAITVGDYGERISGVLLGGEHVERVETAFHELNSPRAAILAFLEPLQFYHCPLIAHITGVEGGLGLEQDNMDLVVGFWQVLDAFGHDDEFTGRDEDVAIAEAHFHAAFHDEKHFVFVVVVVPDERAFKFHDFHVGVVDFADDFRAPVFGDLGELFIQIHDFHLILPLLKRWRPQKIRRRAREGRCRANREARGLHLRARGGALRSAAKQAGRRG